MRNAGPPPFKPLPGAHKKKKWPITHRERIQELEDYFPDPRFTYLAHNIRAAIEWHRSFDLDAYCSREKVWFVKGKLFDGEPTWDDDGGDSWVEVLCPASRLRQS